MRRIWTVVGVFLVAGCASRYEAAADRDGWEIADEKMAAVKDFRGNLVDPRRKAVSRKQVAPPIDVPSQVTLEDAIRIGTKYNRSYQTQREIFFLSALGLTLTRRDFLKPVFSGSVSVDLDDGRSVDLADSTVLSLTGTQFLPTGGRVTVTGTGSIGHAENEDGIRVQDSSVSGTVSFNQPLLRDAWNKVAFEPLKQAERDVLYSARSFEEFRQTFAIDVVDRYYRLVVEKKSLKNEENNVASQDRALREAEARYSVRKGDLQNVLRSKTDLRRAQNGLLDARQGYQRSLDDFKIFLGLPVDVQFDIGDEIPAVEDLEVDIDAAVNAALKNRLDLLTEREQFEDNARDLYLARNRLLPDLDLDAAYSIFSAAGSDGFDDLAFDSDTVSLTLTLELPFDRLSERNSYRSALIDYDRARRDLRETEDQVILEVRDSLRRLRQQKAQIENDELNIEDTKRRVRKAEIDLETGAGSNRELVEQTEQLFRDQNSLLSRYVTYHTTRLTLIRQIGLLFVDKDGIIIQ